MEGMGGSLGEQWVEPCIAPRVLKCSLLLRLAAISGVVTTAARGSPLPMPLAMVMVMSGMTTCVWKPQKWMDRMI